MGKRAILRICPKCYKSYPAGVKICSQCKLELLGARHQHLEVLTKKTKKQSKKQRKYF